MSSCCTYVADHYTCYTGDHALNTDHNAYFCMGKYHDLGPRDCGYYIKVTADRKTGSTVVMFLQGPLKLPMLISNQL